ncbi:hypothetical protein RB195_022721 [Necator americanus]|uniref:Ig-like domain-containing protein n=1 Tax=Necator americanus TaxID=51031 RepID=A0ABR1EGE7_NECAM
MSRAREFEKAWEDENPRKAYALTKQFSGEVKRCPPVLKTANGVAYPYNMLALFYRQPAELAVGRPEQAYCRVVVITKPRTSITTPLRLSAMVDQNNNGTLFGHPDPPQLVFPSKENRPDSPIVVDVVVGQDIILECVFVRAKIVWTKVGKLSSRISLTDDEARLRQIWGNLRIRQAKKKETFPINDGHPQVYYSLVVHAPTNVHLEVNQNVRDKSWQLSCLAKNVRYEIPMVYVNGTPLIDAISEMGVASTTNFYSNPVNATIKIIGNYSGSVQCISRPAMDEAEVYGVGLERGRSHNMYVVSSPSKDHLIKQGPVNVTAVVGEDVELICLVMQRVSSKYWLKDGSYVPFGAARTQRVGSNSLKIYKVEKEDEGWYTCVVVGEGSEKSEQQAYLSVHFHGERPELAAPGESHVTRKKDDVVTMEDVQSFVSGSHVRIQWSVIGKMEALTSIVGFRIESRNDANDSWTAADNVGSHVRATTITGLVPNNRIKPSINQNQRKSFFTSKAVYLEVDVVRKPQGKRGVRVVDYGSELGPEAAYQDIGDVGISVIYGLCGLPIHPNIEKWTCGNRGIGGVGVLVNTSIAKNIDSFAQLTTRIRRLRMRRCGPTPALTVFVAYAPTSS